MSRFAANAHDLDIRIVVSRNHAKIDLVFLLKIEHNQNLSVAVLNYTDGTSRTTKKLTFPARFCQRISNADAFLTG
jgi:hypothetical protein